MTPKKPSATSSSPSIFSCLFVASLLLLLSACGGGGGSMESASEGNVAGSESGTGVIAFQIEDSALAAKEIRRESWLSGAAALVLPQSAIAAFPEDCAGDVVSVSAIVYDENDAEILRGGPWICSARQGRLEGVPAGPDRKLVLMARNGANEMVYRSDALGIAVISGQTTEVSMPAPTPFVPVWTVNDSFPEWESVTGAVEYRVQVEEEGGTVVEDSVITGESTSLADLLPAFGPLRVRVYAVDAFENEGIASKEKFFQPFETEECQYDISASQASFSSDGGQGTISVNTSPNCSWTAQTDANWISFGNTGNGGIGNGTIEFSIRESIVNTERLGRISIAEETISIRQDEYECLSIESGTIEITNVIPPPGTPLQFGDTVAFSGSVSYNMESTPESVSIGLSPIPSSTSIIPIQEVAINQAEGTISFEGSVKIERRPGDDNPVLSGVTVTASLWASEYDCTIVSDKTIAYPVSTQSGAEPEFRFSSSIYEVNEGDSFSTIAVNRIGSSNGTASVRYTTDGTGSAQPNVDFLETDGTLVFPDGVSSQTFQVAILSDEILEGDETIGLELFLPDGATLGSPSSAIITIVEEVETEPELQFSSSAYAVNEGDGFATVTVIRAGSSTGTARVGYTTDGTGSAQPNVDFSETSGTLIFPDGVSSQTFQVEILNDGIMEADETIGLELFLPDGATLGSPSSAIITISDDAETEPEFRFSSSAYVVNEGDGFATITVNRVGSLTGTASVDYGFTGTATLNDDFLDDGSGTLIFPDGVSSQNFQVAILNDEVLEGDETIVMELLIPDGAILGSPSSAILTIIDDDECVFALTPSSATIAAEGGEGEFSVSYTLGCNYVDTNDDDWITYTAQSFGTEATVQYFVSPNTTGQPRTGIISVGNNDFTIFQEAEQPIGDTTPPEVVSVTPPNGTENIDSNNDIVIQIEFSEEMDPSTISPETILLNQDDGTMGVGYLDSSDYSYSNRTATIIIPGGGSGYDYNIQVTTQVKDLAGNSIPSTYESYFATDLKLW